MSSTKQYEAEKLFLPNQTILAYYHLDSWDSINFNMHFHDFYELNIVISGNGKHFLDGSTFHVTSGDVFIVSPGVLHGYEFNSKHYSVFHLLFNKTFFKKYQSELSNINGYEILFNIEPKIRSKKNSINSFLHINISDNYNLLKVFDELNGFYFSESNHNGELQKEYLTLYVITKICALIEDEKNIYNNNKQYLFELLKSIEYIHTNFGSKIDLQMLYDISCMSRSSYIRSFKQFFNCTPIKYIQEYRLRQAKSLLKHTDHSLTIIANDCGFCDSAHFCRLFKEKYAISPSKYREILRQSDKQI